MKTMVDDTETKRRMGELNTDSIIRAAEREVKCAHAAMYALRSTLTDADAEHAQAAEVAHRTISALNKKMETRTNAISDQPDAHSAMRVANEFKEKFAFERGQSTALRNALHTVMTLVKDRISGLPTTALDVKGFGCEH